MISFFLLLFSLSIPVEARDYHIQASDGELYTVTLRLNNEPDIRNFSIRNADGEILGGVTEAERAIATELYFAAKLFWNVLPLFAPDAPVEDLEQEVREYVHVALLKLTLAQMAEILVSGAIAPLDSFAQALASGDFSLVSAFVGVLPPAINTARPLEPERRLVETASILAIACGRATSNLERLLNRHWTSYETRKDAISMDEINATWESFHNYIQYRSLAAELISTYLQSTDLKERLANTTVGTIAGKIATSVPTADIPIAGGAISVTPIAGFIVSSVASTIAANRAIDVLEAHIQELQNLAEQGDSRIQETVSLDIAEGKKQSRIELEHEGFFQPRVVVPLEDIRISVDDDPQRLDVRDYFLPNANNLTYIPRSSDFNVVVAQAERAGSSVLLITPKGVGSASVAVRLINFRGLNVTQSFTVTVGQDAADVLGPKPDGAIDHQLILVDGPSQTVDIAGYFSPNNNLHYEVSSNPSGIVAERISGSRVTITPRQLGNASVVVTAYDKNDRSLYAVQTIPVLVYTDRATIVRPPSPAPFTPPTTSNPVVEGLAKGVSVIVQNTKGLGLNIRSNPWVSNNNPDNRIGRVHDGATGTITDGPQSNGGFTWWKIDWDLENKEGWSADFVQGDQIVFRRPPDLEIRDFDVSDDEVEPGEDFRLEAEIRNNGPGESEPTEIYFYYRQSDEENDVRVAGKGKVEVPSLQEGESQDVSLPVEAPITPHTDYDYGAILPSDIPEGYDADLVDPRGQIRLNNVAEEVRVEVSSSPDLIVESISVNKVVVDPGEVFRLEATVRNQGIGQPERDARLHYYRSSNVSISTSDTEVDDDRVSNDALDTNEVSPTESVSLTAPNVPGVYYYGVCVEPVTNENNTRNNCSGGIAITVRETGFSDLAVGLLTLSNDTVSPRESFTLEATIRNQGSIATRPTTLRGYQSSNSSISSNDTEVGSIQVGSLSAGATAVQRLNLNAPLAAGTYYYGVSIETVTSESNTANNTSIGIVLTVENRAPGASGTPPRQALVVGSVATVDVAPYFSDPNEDLLIYKALSDSPGVVVAAFSDLSDAELQLTPLTAGTATITVEVTDGEFTATQSIVVSVTTGGVSEASWMPDANLRAVVREALGLAPGDVLTREAMPGLTELNASAAVDAAASEKIKDLTGLEYATQLTELSLSGNEIVDVSALSGLTQLTELDLGWNKIVDISALGSLTQLKTLFLWANFRISNISALAGLTQLETLMLNGNAISNISALSGLTQLTKLDLVGGRISNISALSDLTQLTLLRLGSNEIVDVSPLSGLTQLTELSLSGNEIVDVSALAGLVQLRGLDLRDNAIVEVSALEGLINLEWLRLGGNPITDFAPLRRLKAESPDVKIDIDISVVVATVPEETWMPDANLRTVVREALGLAPNDALTQQAMQRLTKLDASVTEGTDTSKNIKDLTGLEHATQLTWLDLFGTILESIRPLSSLTQLTQLYLGRSGVVNLNPLSSLTQLRELDLYQNGVVDLSPLSGLTQLRRLDVTNLGFSDGVVDLGPLSGLTQLRELILESNKIVDLNPLSDLTQLTWLHLGSNGIVDVSALSDLTQLTRLSLRNNKIVDVGPLSGLTQLKWLYLVGNEIVDVSPFEELINLENLYLAGNPITDFAPLRRLKAKNPDMEIDINIGTVPTAVSEDVWMPDANLRAAVRKALDLAPGDVLTKGTMQRLTRLDVSIWDAPASEKINDLTGLEHATQLRTLVLIGNKVVNVNALSNLTQLTWLSLYYNEMVDVSALSNLTQVTTLLLSYNEIVDVSPLSSLTQLTRLELRGNKISNVSALEGLINLEYLNLSENPISDLTPLRRLKAKNPSVEIDIDINAETTVISEETWMPDANLRAAVRKELDLAPGDILTQEAMAKLTSIFPISSGILVFPVSGDISFLSINGGIKDLTGLEYAAQLTELHLGGNDIVDLKPLAKLTQLTILGLPDNDIVDVSPLAELTQLTKLYLGDNKIVDVSSLAELTQLTTLSLGGNDIADVSPLAELTQLITLYLGDNKIVDVSPLAELTQLANLYLKGNRIVGVSPLVELTQLAKLSLGGNKIVDVSPLSGLTHLTGLYLGDNEIVDVSPLSGLTQLTALRLASNEIVDVSPLSGLTQLTALRLASNEIVDVSPLSGLTQLTWLYLDENKIRDVSALEGLINLEYLYLSENPIVDLSPLRRLKAKNPDMEIDIDISIETPIISDGTAAPHVYWTLFDRGKIQRANPDGTSVRTLFTKLVYPISVAVDVAGGKIYWTISDFGAGTGNKIQRANLDGTNIQDIVTNELLGRAYIALDVAGGKIYWTNDDTSGNNNDKIQRANLDGTNIQDIVTEEVRYLNGIALDVTRKKIYWTNLYKIQRANLDGSNVQDIFVNSGAYNLFGIALDVTGGKVYWGNPSRSKIQRANLDGSNVQDIVTGVKSHSIALNVAGGKVYWSNPSRSKIQRANLDGSNVEDIVTGVRDISGIALGTFSQNPPPVVPVAREDVNRDGVIDLQDTTVVRANLGQTGQNDADVNDDNVVDVDDLVLVLAAIENAAAAPTAHTRIQQMFTTKEVQRWLTEAQLSEDTSHAYLRGITMLEQILALLIPQETALLANYPNPFNPETWIPYQLSKSTDVSVLIYSVNGHLVRHLDLGHRTAGIYQSKSRAAYWDGHNNSGERVASGVYFYTLTASDFTATRKMLILK